MRIHPPKLSIDENDPFKNALFNRKAFAGSLTSLLRNVSDNLVILVHAPWGAGKTTFAHMWRADLRRQHLNVVYFDAYASDYFNDPFVCFSGEILQLAEQRFSEGKGLLARGEFKKSAVEVAKRLAGLATKVALKSATLGALDDTHLKELKNISSELASGIAEVGAKVVEDSIKNYAAEKDCLTVFKKSLAKLAAIVREEQGFPLTIVVDELDRCRPDFALALLERIKHLFDVDGVAFVLLVNNHQIENYIKRIYGEVDAHAYLLKFANLFVELPHEPDTHGTYQPGRQHYCDTLYAHYELSQIVTDGPFQTSSPIGMLAMAQDPIRNALTMGFGDVAATKKKAEAGDAQAQRSLADSLASNFRGADALQWYQKSANQGNVEAAYHLGNMLLFGGAGIPKEQRVEPNPPEGIRWTFRAATNRHADACWNISKDLQRGIGVTTNSIEAYAWLQVAADLSPAPIVQRVHLNNMALTMDSRSSSPPERPDLASDHCRSMI